MDSENKWLKSAPADLVADFKAGKIKKERDLFARLLTDRKMDRVWKSILRKNPSRLELHNLWGAIMTAKGRANRSLKGHVTRADRISELRSIAQRIGDLAHDIAETDLDILAYLLLQPDTLEALGVPNLLKLPDAERDAVAHRLLKCWPSATEILLGLEKLANIRAKAISSQPAHRSSGDVVMRAFVRELGPRFKGLFGDYMYGSLAIIANVTFPTAKVGGIDKGAVQQALRGYS